MSREEHRARIPTGEELERAGAVAPLGAGPAEKRRGLLGFLRVGRIRVSGDVAARKYTPAERRREQEASRPTPQQGHETGPVTDVTASAGKPKDRPGLAPRQIRIDASVRERRGLGGSGQRP